MAIETRVSEAAYERFVWERPDQQWELWDGELREKPAMSWEHGGVESTLFLIVAPQLDPTEFQMRFDSRVRRPVGNIFVPDLFVVPTVLRAKYGGHPGRLAIIDEPLPLVVEVWSPSTGDYDVSDKLPEYMRRGDLEIWYVHPYERTLTAWVRQPDGSYVETVYRSGVVRPTALPGVEIDLAVLFEA